MKKSSAVLFLCLALLVVSQLCAQQDEIESSGPLFPVRKNGKWGYIDKTGNVVISPQFRIGLGFSGGLAQVKVDHRWGYIDRTGKMVIRPQFEWAWHFTEGLAAVEVGASLAT